MIAARRVMVADKYQRRALHVAETMGRLPVVPRDNQMNELRQLGMGGVSCLKKRFDFFRMAQTKVFCEKCIGVAKLLA